MNRKTPMPPRKQPMKRSGKLRPMSTKKAALMPAYRKMVAEQSVYFSHCVRCRKMRVLEPHHPAGRIGLKLFHFIMICRECHDWIHANAKQARIDGCLSPLANHLTNYE